MALSVATPKHLKTIGLLDKEEKDHGIYYYLSLKHEC